MRIYLVCPVRKCPPEIKEKLEAYVAKLEADGHVVHYPHRDVPQDAPGPVICSLHRSAMVRSDAIHVWWEQGISTGTYFDFGMAYMLMTIRPDLKFVIVNPMKDVPVEKSYYGVLADLVENPHGYGHNTNL